LTLLVVLILALLAVSGRLVQIQMVDGPAYAAAAADQRTREIEISAERGFVLDRDGEVLAESVQARTVYAVPGSVLDKEGTARTIADTLGGEQADYLERLRREGTFVYLARKADAGRAASLEALGIGGLGFIEDSRRVYPSNELACQVLGFVGVDDAGLSGIELFYDELLTGEAGRLIGERDTRGRPIPGGVTYEVEAVDGKDVVLTIDKDIQYQAQVALAEAVEAAEAKAGSVLVMDPGSGEILAMASVPTFDPNRFGQSDQESYRNRGVVDIYEPGSTMKAFTAAAVLEEGLFTPESTFDLPPTLTVGGRTIREATRRERVSYTLTEIIRYSSNVGSAMMAEKLGPRGLYGYLEAFGFTEPTGIDFPGEVRGRLAAPEAWSGSSLATIAFGQGIAVTPLQLARGYAAIANGGELVTPHLLKEVPDAPEISFAWPKRRAVSESTADTVRSILTEANAEGAGSLAEVPGYTVAGKTGTAQKPRTDGQAGYDPGKYVASFCGFLPAEDPRVLVLVVIDEPSGSYYYGSQVAAPVFSRIAGYCMEHLRVPPPARVTGPAHSGDD
jgi:cell division protein FtsI (penicillin-binding protein 3)